MSDTPSPHLFSFESSKVKHRLCFLINLVYFAVLSGIAILVVRYLFLWMLPFVLAFIVASVLQRPMKYLSRKTKVSKKFFSVILVILLIFLIASIVAFAGWKFTTVTAHFINDKNNMKLLQTTLVGVSNTIRDWLVGNFSSLSPELMDSLQDSLSGSASGLVNFLTAFLGDALNFVTTELPLLLVSFIIWIVASIFLTIDYHKVISFIFRQVPNRFSELVNSTKELCTNTVFKLLKAYLLLMSITFVELSIGLTILHVPYSVLFAALIAVVDILPVLGTGTIIIPWAFISLIMNDPHMFFGLLILYIIITVLRNILEPRLVSHQIGLNPLVTLFFMYLGLKVLGLAGMLLFPVIVMILKQLQESGKIKLWK